VGNEVGEVVGIGVGDAEGLKLTVGYCEINVGVKLTEGNVVG
jgi:hypothetical protein